MDLKCRQILNIWNLEAILFYYRELSSSNIQLKMAPRPSLGSGAQRQPVYDLCASDA